MYSALHTASLASRHLRSGLTPSGASKAGRHLRTLLGCDTLVLADAAAILPGKDPCPTLPRPAPAARCLPDGAGERADQGFRGASLRSLGFDDDAACSCWCARCR
ncbi:hypothetical protein GCM10017708_39240 [Arthrobacter citreus]